MTKPTLIPAPADDFAGELHYVAQPRPKRSFHTVLDAGRLLGGKTDVRVSFAEDSNDIVVAVELDVARGRLRDETRFERDGGGLITSSLHRTVTTHDGDLVREERVAFKPPVYELPTACYPELALPHLLGWLPFDGQRRSLFAWINDRFVARVYVEQVGRQRSSSVEYIMYPDLNDWVALGGVLTRLAKPFLPKYRMWFDSERPFRLVRFEGPYGPPGAPEIILELDG